MAMRHAEPAVLVLEANTSQVGYARRFVRGVLSSEVDAGVVDGLQLIASELFTNAVEHGDNETVRLEVTLSHEHAGVSVRSHGVVAHLPPAADWRVAGQESVTGRGLGIVRALADELTVERQGDDVTVTARCFLHSSATTTG